MGKSAIVIGSGIVGLAMARALSVKGYSVTVVERGAKATGASIRNFGMIWPVGQPSGQLYSRAMRSRSIWKEIGNAAGFWYDECGSLHLAYHDDEWTVLQELNEVFKDDKRAVSLLSPAEVKEKFNGVNASGLQGGMFSASEVIVDPREAIAAIPAYLSDKYQVKFIWNTNVTAVKSNSIIAGNKSFSADLICICSGADFETLYPGVFASLNVTKCKLQMMRFINDTDAFRIGTALCGGLSLIHYDSFKAAPSLNLLKKRYQEQMPEYLRLGIHVMVSQNGRGELTVGDSHEYGLSFTPFDEAYINDLVISYLKKFAVTDRWKQIQSWHGIYPKMTNGNADLFWEAEDGVYIINGLGGAGMTLSFGFAEEVCEKF
ncbi:MAG TPA: TIGR03364 family FAD-dependent oxidoreductase [Chitinophagaceae bacterium]|nr:TIGR03364 family FAD-dependent oxidoreductase [Chitinophagaceae bacterium]